jgi:thioredoxin reductase (NADPH)
MGVYGASEGLRTMLQDSVAVRGRPPPARGSRITSAFPSGLSGIEFSSRALVVQANKFGARVCSPCEVVSLESDHGHLHMVLSDGQVVETRAVVVSTGAQYRKLALEGWSGYEGAGVLYAATDLGRARARRSRWPSS